MKWVKKYIIENFSNFTFFFSVLRYRLLIVFVLAILSGLLDSLGLTMFLPLLQMADGGSTTDMGNLSFITDGLLAMGIQLSIIKALFILVLVFFLKGVVIYYSGIYRIKTQQLLTRKIRMNIINEFVTFPYEEYVSTDVGKVQNIFIGEVDRLYNTYISYTQMIQGVVMIIIYIFFTFIVDWKFALLVCLGGILSNLVFIKLNKLTEIRSKNISQVNNVFSGMLLQYIVNFKYLKGTGQIKSFRDKVEKSIEDVQHEKLHISILSNWVTAFREPMLIMIIALVIGVQVYFIGATISAIIVSLLFFYRALVGIVGVQANYNMTLANQGAIDNILQFYSNMIKSREVNGNVLFERFEDKIELRDISFSYGSQNILKKISFSINKNECVALIGESGSGKTTLANILIKLLSTRSGHISIDKIKYEDLNNLSFQKKIGYISQEPVIFNDSIYNNITFWAEKTPVNIKKFKNAIHAAFIADYITGLPNQEETLLGNNGVNLSGGQRQRISIARELYKEIEILVLDEATSALDSETEKQIQANLEQLQGKITMIVIAHRLFTIKKADKIVLLEKGEVSHIGTFTELIENSAEFRSMIYTQHL
ncbi:ABC transporter ATP-binding protein [Chryseobacterium sp. T1]